VLTVIARYDRRTREVTAFSVGRKTRPPYETFTPAKSLKGVRSVCLRAGTWTSSVFSSTPPSTRNSPSWITRSEELKQSLAHYRGAAAEGLFKGYNPAPHPRAPECVVDEAFPTTFPSTVAVASYPDPVGTRIDLRWIPARFPASKLRDNRAGSSSARREQVRLNLTLRERGCGTRTQRNRRDPTRKVEFFRVYERRTSRATLVQNNKADREDGLGEEVHSGALRYSRSCLQARRI